MDSASLAIWLIALILGVVSFFRPGNLHVKGLKTAWDFTYKVFPRMILAILVCGFFSVIVPTDLVVSWLGKESGMKGILIASLVGGFTPGGPIISFPIVVIFFKAGAGIPSLIAYLTAWTTLAFHRTITYEIPLLGFRFTVVRILSTLLLPPLAGILAIFVEGHF
ncbi:MAG: permease [Thermodesulfobacteriota bacterium]